MRLVRLTKNVLNVTYSKVCIDKYFSDRFTIQNGLKQGDALPPLLFNFVSEYAIRKAQENHIGLKLSGTHQLLGYADDVNLLGDKIHIVMKNTQTLIHTSEEVGLEVNVNESKYLLCLVTRRANRSFENVAQFRHFEMTEIDKNFIQKEIKGRLTSGNACYHSVQSLYIFSSAV
jgi:hypothetical protein